MKIRIDDIPEEGLVLNFSGDSDILSESLVSVPVPSGTIIDPYMKGRLQIPAGSGELFMIGYIETSVRMACSRCLAEFSRDVNLDVSLIFRRRDAQNPAQEADRDEPDGDFTFFEGPEIDPGEAIVQEILLALPMKALCREDCPGLCPHCGAMKGSPECECPDQDRVDPRWEALEELKKRISP